MHKTKRTILVIGHSHIGALLHASEISRYGVFSFLDLRQFGPGALSTKSSRGLVIEHVGKKIQDADAVILCCGGNQHNIVGMFDNDEALTELADIVGKRTYNWNHPWLSIACSLTDKPVAVLAAPPPYESLSLITGRFREKMEVSTIRDPKERLQLWDIQMRATYDVATKFGVPLVKLPDDVFSHRGFLAADCCGNDPTHANAVYGERVLKAVVEHFENGSGQTALLGNSRRAHFYTGLPDYAYWKQSISELPQAAVDPVASAKFVVSCKDRVAAAGSCFAQHILKRLQGHNFNCLITEPAPAVPEGHPPPAQFSARFGNIYTSRQLLQLFDRAYGHFQPEETAWKRRDGRYCDPFRPTVEPDGFATEKAVVDAAQDHLQAVRSMFEALDVFVFTLGLTECWRSRKDGAAYPIAPGVAGGRYDPGLHEMVNLSVTDVVDDLEAFLARLKRVNPKARVLFTVSPVPLVATAEDRHVLVSTTWSKSVLRVAAGQVADAHAYVEYFPSYEIITGPHAQGGYFGPDRRAVTERGVDHVMKVFFSRMTDAEVKSTDTPESQLDAHLREMEALAEAACDEEMLAKD